MNDPHCDDLASFVVNRHFKALPSQKSFYQLYSKGSDNKKLFYKAAYKSY